MVIAASTWRLGERGIIHHRRWFTNGNRVSQINTNSRKESSIQIAKM